MEPSTLPACPHVSHVSPSPLLVTCPLERFGLHFGLNKLLVSVILHVDMHLASLSLLHQFWRDLTLHDALQELPVLRVVVQSDVPVVNTEAVSPHLQDESSGFFFLRCSTGSSDLTKGSFSSLFIAEPRPSLWTLTLVLGVSSLPSRNPPPENARAPLELSPVSEGSTGTAPASLNALKKSPTFVTFFFFGPRI